jgi:hypothetical protein
MAFLIFVIAAGLFAVWMGFRALRKRRELDRDGVTTTGVVYRLDSEHNSRNRTYTPIISYTDERGVERKFRSDMSSSRVAHPVGSAVPLRYLRARPEVVQLDTASYRRSSVLLPTLIGTVFIVAAVAALVFHRY